MNTTMLAPTFLATALATLLAIAALGLSRKLRSGAETWLIPILVILAIVSLGAFFLYLFATAGIPAAGS
jgi:hypothetical protein